MNASNRQATRVLAAAAVLLAPSAAAQAQSPVKPVLSPAYLTPQTVAALSLQPKQVLTDPAMALLPIEVAKAAGEKYLGMDPASITQAVVVAEPPAGLNPFYAVFLRADQDWDLSKLHLDLTSHTRPGKIGGRDALVSENPLLPCWMVLKGHTLFGGSKGMMEKFFAANKPKPEGALADLLASHPAGDDVYLAVDIEQLRPLILLATMQAGQQVEPELQPLLQLPNHIQSAELAINVTNALPSRLAVNSPSSSDAAQLQQIVDGTLAAIEQKMRSEAEPAVAKLRSSDDPVERAMGAYLDRVSDSYFEVFKPKRDGDSMVLFDSREVTKGSGTMTQMATTGVLVALLLPAVQAARDAARRAQEGNDSSRFDRDMPRQPTDR